MGYFVLGDDGQKYGPADVATLNQWVQEGRIVSQTLLEDEATGFRAQACTVPGMNFPLAAPPAAPPAPPMNPSAGQFQNPPGYTPPNPQYSRPYSQPTYTSAGGGSGTIYIAFGVAILSPILSFFLPIGGLISAMYAIRAAIRAKDEGHPLGVVAIVVAALAIGFWAFTRATGMGRGMFLR